MREPHLCIVESIDTLPESDVKWNQADQEDTVTRRLALLRIRVLEPISTREETAHEIHVYQWPYQACQNITEKEVFESHKAKWGYHILKQRIQQFVSEWLLHNIKWVQQYAYKANDKHESGSRNRILYSNLPNYVLLYPYQLNDSDYHPQEEQDQEYLKELVLVQFVGRDYFENVDIVNFVLSVILNANTSSQERAN